MCGVCGFVRHQMPAAACRAVLKTMCGMLSHRGPDDEGFYVDEEMALGHRRLSIIDLSAGGHQPMSADGLNAWISFNGEIYNFLDLKAELSARGCRFRTRTDTEVILRAYQIFGEQCVEHLNGMFAFALWDAAEKKLLLVRDRLGKKPLYYFHHNEQFVFASEMKAILAVPGIPREIDMAALDHFLTHGYIPAPWSIFKHIRKVAEAGYLVFQNGQAREKSYWVLPPPQPFSHRREEEYAEELEMLLQDAVRCRLISDVPLGAFLSGGVDSSAIVALMAKRNGQSVKTFTIDFNEKTFSEVEDARRVADHCGTEHHVLQVTTDAVSLLPEMVWQFDEPFADSSAIPTYYVSKMAREHVTVILSGDGGDELFAGYNNYAKRDQYRHMLRLPRSIRHPLFNRIAQALPIHAPMRNFLKFVANAAADDGPGALGIYPYLKQDLLTREMNNQLAGFDATDYGRELLKACMCDDKLARLQYLDTRHYLPGDILVKVDRMSMAHSLETRAPLLDYRLAEFAVRLPMSLRVQAGVSKYLLKKVMRPYLPAAILGKAKHGFSVPIGLWLQTCLNGFARETLLDERARQRGLFNAAVVAKVLKYHAQGRRDYSTWIWTLLNLELWFQIFIDSSTRRI